MSGWQRSIENTKIGQRQAQEGSFTELKASTDPVDEHGVGDRGFNDGRYLVFDEIIQAATDTLTAAELKGTIINNYGQSAVNIQTLPAAAKGLSALFVLSTIGNAFHIDVQAGDKFYLDGVALDDGDKISCSTPVVGNRLSVVAVQTGADSYDWLALSIQGTWTDGGV